MKLMMNTVFQVLFAKKTGGERKRESWRSRMRLLEPLPS